MILILFLENHSQATAFVSPPSIIAAMCLESKLNAIDFIVFWLVGSVSQTLSFDFSALKSGVFKSYIEMKADKLFLCHSHTAKNLHLGHKAIAVTSLRVSACLINFISLDPTFQTPICRPTGYMIEGLF